MPSTPRSPLLRPGRRLSSLLLLIVMGVIGAGLGGGRQAWLRNTTSLVFARGVDASCNGDDRGALVLCAQQGQRISPEEQVHGRMTDCQLLWLSRLQASQSLAAAATTFQEAQRCERVAHTSAWGGQLAWLQGDNASAKQWWRYLSPQQQVDWAYGELLVGDAGRGKQLLGGALERGEEMSPELAAQAFSRLGLAYRSAGDWGRAVAAYEAAHRLDPNDAEIIFYLGMSYRLNGQASDAIVALQNGLSLVIPSRYNRFISDYYVQLGQAHQDSAQFPAAGQAYEEALAWLGKDDPVDESQVRFVRTLLQSVAETDGANE